MIDGKCRPWSTPIVESVIGVFPFWVRFLARLYTVVRDLNSNHQDRTKESKWDLTRRRSVSIIDWVTIATLAEGEMCGRGGAGGLSVRRRLCFQARISSASYTATWQLYSTPALHFCAVRKWISAVAWDCVHSDRYLATARPLHLYSIFCNLQAYCCDLFMPYILREVSTTTLT